MKHLVDLDEAALADAREHLGTTTIKDTLNAALRLVAGRDPDDRHLDEALAVLAGVDFDDRSAAWR